MKNKYFGYARVSTIQQNEDRQIEAFKAIGANDRYIYCDKQSGKDFDRLNYNLLVGTPETSPLLREGDLLTIYSIDRLGRNYTQIQEQWRYITNVIGADIRVIDMPLLDTSTDNSSIDGRFIADLTLQILSYVAEKERINIKARQMQGIQTAKKNGKKLGRPEIQFPDNWEHTYKRWKAKEITAVMAMDIMKLRKNTFYNLVKRYETDKGAESNDCK